MSSTFFGINVARTGLAAQKRAMDVLGYNIANANDPTYKRQRVVQSEGQVLATSTEASPLGSTPFGTGVGSGDVERVRDTLIEHRMTIATQSASNWSLKSNLTAQIESILGEPSDTGLQNDLDNLWDSWQKVATTPDSLPIRSGLVEDAQALCQRMQDVVGQFKAMKDDLNLQVQDKVDRINVIGEEIANLNNQIGSLESGAMPINDLQNRRDALVQEMAKLININQNGDGKESYMVSVSGTMLVQGTKFTPLATAIDPATGQKIVTWSDTGAKVDITNGELAGVIEIRDQTIPDYLSQLDNVAVGLVEYVNNIHEQGYDLLGNKGQEFFTPNDPPGSISAANISVSAALAANSQLVAASAEAPLPGPPVTPVVGNGEIAKQIAALKDITIDQFPPKPRTDTYQVFTSPLSLDQMYRKLVGDIGSSAAIASRQETAQKLSYDQFAQQAQAISGVSLDEEMTNMVKFQQAYNASSRVLGVMDEMLSTLINAGR
jgi:flagellar hook-associated protein 1 FlgK